MKQLFPGASFEIPSPPFFDIEESARLTVTALTELGVKGFDDTEQRVAEAADAYRALHERLIAESVRPKDKPEPFIGITLTDRFGLDALVARFDAKQPHHPTFVDAPIWSQVSADEANRRFTVESGMVQKDPGSMFTALAMLRGSGNGIDDGGLYFVGQNDAEQTISVGKEPLVNPADQVVLNAQRRLMGGPLLSATGFNRFVQIERKPAYDRSWRPYAVANDGQVFLYGGYGDRRDVGGVRLLGGVEAQQLKP